MTSHDNFSQFFNTARVLYGGGRGCGAKHHAGNDPMPWLEMAPGLPPGIVFRIRGRKSVNFQEARNFQGLEQMIMKKGLAREEQGFENYVKVRQVRFFTRHRGTNLSVILLSRLNWDENFWRPSKESRVQVVIGLRCIMHVAQIWVVFGIMETFL